MEGCSLPEQPPRRHKGCCREIWASSYGNGEGRCTCRYSGLLSQGTGRGTRQPESKRRKPFLELWRSSEHSQLTFLTKNPPSPTSNLQQSTRSHWPVLTSFLSFTCSLVFFRRPSKLEVSSWFSMTASQSFLWSPAPNVSFSDPWQT